MQGSVGTVSHISQLSKMFQCFTSCLKSQAAAPMPPAQLRTFTLSDGDSLEPRVWDVGALPINAVLSQINKNWIMQTLARKNLFTNSPCVSFILSLTVQGPRLCFQMFPILEILTSSLASWHLDKQAIHIGVVSAGEAVSCIHCIPLVGAASSTCNDGDGHVINCHHLKMICIDMSSVFMCFAQVSSTFHMETNHCNIS